MDFFRVICSTYFQVVFFRNLCLLNCVIQLYQILTISQFSCFHFLVKFNKGLLLHLVFTCVLVSCDCIYVIESEEFYATPIQILINCFVQLETNFKNEFQWKSRKLKDSREKLKIVQNSIDTSIIWYLSQSIKEPLHPSQATSAEYKQIITLDI